MKDRRQPGLAVGW